MRLVGLIVILAQVGCFVPASFARLGITDRIFTRVGAVDDLSLGQSTFQVEMAETAAILSQATSNSLVLLDEIGRGTAVADGIAIAWAVAEHMAGAQVSLQSNAGDPSLVEYCSLVPRTIFVTHYHELNELAALRNVEPFRMQTICRTSEKRDGPHVEDWVYTHRIVPGPSFDSYGIAIARRAGFPHSVIARAEYIHTILQEPAKSLAAHLRKRFMLGGIISSDDGEIEERQHPEEDENSIEGVHEKFENHMGVRGSEPSLWETVFDEGFVKGLAAGKAAGRKAALSEISSMLRELEYEE